MAKQQIKNNPKVLGLDVSTKTIGWALFDMISGDLLELTHISPVPKPKEENKDFFAVIKSIPADMTNMYNSAIKISTDVGNMMSNSRRTVNDITDAITGDDNSEDINRPSLDDGRGGDNFIHFGSGGASVDSKYSMKAQQIVPIINNIN